MKKAIKTWQTHSPTFEFSSEFPVETSGWIGHYFFAYDLIANTKPKIIVELGTHMGNSLFSFAQAIKDLELDAKLHAVDTWKGDKHAGFYENDVYKSFLEIVDKYYKDVNITPHKMYFDEAVKKFEDQSIDILHIDGLHTYEAVKHDFETWLPKVNKKNGIVLLHDVCEKSKDFGVYKLWDELKEKYPTYTFNHSHGLGVLFLNDKMLGRESISTEIIDNYYRNMSEIRHMKKEIQDKENHINNLTDLNLVRLKTIKDLVKEKEEATKENQNLRDLKEDALEFRDFKQTKIWRGLTMYRKIKKYTKNFFINIFKDGPILTFKRIFERIGRITEHRKRRKIEQNRYQYWLEENEITKSKEIKIQKELKSLEYNPLISIIMPVYNVDLKWIKAAVNSVKEQIYTNCELCIADDKSSNPELIKYLKQLDEEEKIKVVFREKNGHISEASNSALELATGEFIALMDNDDIIYPHALAEIVTVLNKKKDTDLIYSDEDKLTIEGERVEPFFKPDWSPDLFLSTNYLCHLTVIRKNLIDEIGGFRKGFEGSQDYDLFLRVTEKTKNIEHIPDILYSWRKIPGSTASNYNQKGYATETSIKALEDAIKRRNLNATVTKGLFPGSFRVRYHIENNPLVSIIIPTKDKTEYIERCISSIFEKTTYKNFEINIIDTGSTEKETLDYYKTLKSNPKINILKWGEKFNYSSVNNYGVENSKGEYILLLNNDTEIITPDWIEGMLEHAQRQEIGAVGVKLYYPNDLIQHAGVVLGINGGLGTGIAGHAFKGFPKTIQGFPVQKDVIRNYSAVTAACLMIEKKKFKEVNGLDKKYRIAFNDVDFCLRLREKGYYNIYTSYVELYHHESVSVGTPEAKTRDTKEFSKETQMMYEKWNGLLLNDPFYNKNLTLRSEDFAIKISEDE